MRGIFHGAALCAALLLPGPCRAAAPVAEYNFQNTLASSVAGAPDLVDLVDANNQDPNTFTTATVDGATRTVLHFQQFNGVALEPTTELIQSGVYSIVVLFSFEESGGYRRILDFKNGSTDNGVYSYGGALNFYPITTGTAVPITTDTFHQIVMMRDASGQITGYVDGAQQISFHDCCDYGTVDENNRLRFFQDNTGGNAPVRESSAGNVARIRIYNVALTPEEVAGLDRLPGAPPERIRLLRIIGGLDAATPDDIAAFDKNGDKALTLFDLASILRQ